jgi:hypothetical protein
MFEFLKRQEKGFLLGGVFLPGFECTAHFFYHSRDLFVVPHHAVHICAGFRRPEFDEIPVEIVFVVVVIMQRFESFLQVFGDQEHPFGIQGTGLSDHLFGLPEGAAKQGVNHVQIIRFTAPLALVDGFRRHTISPFCSLHNK